MRILLFSLAMLLSGILLAQDKSVEAIVQANLDAYNNRDIESFMFYIGEDVEFYNLGECEPYLKGKEEVRKRYTTYFEKSPKLHSEIKNRMVFDNKVMDFEYIRGSNGKEEAFELIFIYEVVDSKIVKTTAIRK